MNEPLVSQLSITKFIVVCRHQIDRRLTAELYAADQGQGGRRSGVEFEDLDDSGSP
jgi:hypothetical protein